MKARYCYVDPFAPRNRLRDSTERRRGHCTASDEKQEWQHAQRQQYIDGHSAGRVVLPPRRPVGIQTRVGLRRRESRHGIEQRPTPARVLKVRHAPRKVEKVHGDSHRQAPDARKNEDGA